jgi:hypothetical protein
MPRPHPAFPLEEGVREMVQPIPVAAEGGHGLGVALLDDPAGLGVDEFPGRRGHAVGASPLVLALRGEHRDRPDGGDMPQRPTICRAIWLAWSMSFSAPVVTSP